VLHGTWDEHRALLAARRPFENLVMWRRLPDGTLRYINVSGEPMFDRDGRFTGYRGVGADISAQKREEQLLKLEHGVSLRLAEAGSAADGLRAVIRSICETEGWLGGRYWHGDDDAGVLRFREGWGAPGSEMEKYNDQSRGRDLSRRHRLRRAGLAIGRAAVDPRRDQGRTRRAQGRRPEPCTGAACSCSRWPRARRRSGCSPSTARTRASPRSACCRPCG
jgi:hypothetical protein